MPKIISRKEKLQNDVMSLALAGVQAITKRIKEEDLKKVFDDVSFIIITARDSLRDIDSLN